MSETRPDKLRRLAQHLDAAKTLVDDLHIVVLGLDLTGLASHFRIQANQEEAAEWIAADKQGRNS